MGLTDAGPASNLIDESAPNDSITEKNQNRFTELAAPAIAPPPQLVFNKDSTSPQLFVGNEDVTSVAPVLHRSLWYTK